MRDIFNRNWPTLLLAAAALLSLAGCTSISGSLPLDDARTAEFTVFRAWTDAGVTLALPDGTSFSYSSDADTAAASNMNQQLLSILMGGGRLVAPGAMP